ncbi:MAG: cytochrome c oxidase subunit 3 [Chitinophagales bacterium]|nr:cytochrome c oxidase subunit 3 [Chitinophagales bacterium]
MKSSKVSPLQAINKREQVIKTTGKLFLYFGLAAISVLFLCFSGTFVYHMVMAPAQSIQLPSVFHISTLVIIASSVLLQYMLKLMVSGDNKYFSLMALGVFMLGTCFLACQFVGWQMLLQRGIDITSTTAASYLYLLSGLHALHLLVGLLALGVVAARSLLRLNNPVGQLMFETDVFRQYRISLLATYWHFVGLLWIYLYIIFIVVSW